MFNSKEIASLQKSVEELSIALKDITSIVNDNTYDIRELFNDKSEIRSELKSEIENLVDKKSNNFIELSDNVTKEIKVMHDTLEQLSKNISNTIITFINETNMNTAKTATEISSSAGKQIQEISKQSIGKIEEIEKMLKEIIEINDRQSHEIAMYKQKLQELYIQHGEIISNYDKLLKKKINANRIIQNIE